MCWSEESQIIKESSGENREYRWGANRSADDDVSLAASIPLWPGHFSNWLTDGKSLPFGLVSDQVAINQAAKERERAARGRRREDKRSEWTDGINSWPRGSAPRLVWGVMKRCHLQPDRLLNARLDEGALGLKDKSTIKTASSYQPAKIRHISSRFMEQQVLLLILTVDLLF